MPIEPIEDNDFFEPPTHSFYFMSPSQNGQTSRRAERLANHKPTDRVVNGKKLDEKSFTFDFNL